MVEWFSLYYRVGGWQKAQSGGGGNGLFVVVQSPLFRCSFLGRAGFCSFVPFIYFFF